MPASIRIIQVDAFTSERFRGNPAAVCLLHDEPAAAWMQAVAAEMNLSETAFVRPREGGGFFIRWFTPTVEVPLCGHATLSGAHVLWEEKLAPSDEPIALHSRSGPLSARRESGWICLDFPALPVEPAAPPAGLSEALGCPLISAHQNQADKYLLEVASEQAVRELRPDFGRLRERGIEACIVTARSDERSCDFVSRFFAPGMGIDEDPVTGAAHCSLGPFWSERLRKDELVGHQVSKRGGVVRVRVRGERVDILGQAVTVLRGELLDAPAQRQPSN